MSEQDRIAQLLKASIDEGAWYGPTLSEALEGVTAAQAASRPIKGVHTIWELVGHIAVWVEVPLSRYHGKGPEQVAEKDNFPTAPSKPDEKAWTKIKERVWKAHEAWYAELKKMSDNQLHTPRKPGFPPMADILYGVAQHTAYHIGQIVVLKKHL